MLHLRARWYSPYLNQFISPDPIIPNYFNPQSLNRYSYVLNNPVNLIDPTGLTPNCESQKCKLELKSTKIQALGGWLSFVRHLELVFTDPNGALQVAGGFPGGPDIVFDPGSIVTEITDLGDPSAELIVNQQRQGADGGIFTTLIEGDLVCDKWEECLLGRMRAIHDLERPYNFLSANSNSAVYSALKACSIFVSWSGGINNHPGWGNDLFNPPPRPIYIDPVCASNPELCYQNPA